MIPKNYKKKGQGQKPFPFFDLRQLVKPDDCCEVLIVPTGAIRVFRMLAKFLRWPTRWLNENDPQEIADFIRQVDMSLEPCNGVIQNLADAINRLNLNLPILTGGQGSGGNQGACNTNMCMCCCQNGGQTGEPPVYNPNNYPNNPPLPSDVPATVSLDCKFANFMADRYIWFLDKLTDAVVYVAAALLIASLIPVLLGQVYVTAALLSSLWWLFIHDLLSAAAIATISAHFVERKEDFICYVSSHSLNSPSTFKQACMAWCHSIGDDNDPRISFHILYFSLAAPYNYMTTRTDWLADYTDATCCTDDPPIEPPETGVYSLVPTGIILGDVLTIDGQPADYVSVSVEANVVSLFATIEDGGEGYKANLSHTGPTTYCVGWAVMCTRLVKSLSNNPTATFTRDTLSTIIVDGHQGLVRQGTGICGILDTEEGEDIDLFENYLVNLGYHVERNVAWGDILEAHSQGYMEGDLYDKEGQGGHGGVVDTRMEWFMVAKNYTP